MALPAPPQEHHVDQSGAYVYQAARIMSVPNLLSSTPTAADPENCDDKQNVLQNSHRRDSSRSDWVKVSGEEDVISLHVPAPVTSPIKRHKSPRRPRMDASDTSQHHTHQQHGIATSPVSTTAQVTPSLTANAMTRRMQSPFAFSAGPHMLYSQTYVNPARGGNHMPAMSPFLNEVRHQHFHEQHPFYQHQLPNQHPLVQQKHHQQLQPGLQTPRLQSPYSHHYQNQEVGRQFDFRTQHRDNTPLDPQLLPPLENTKSEVKRPSPPPPDIPDNILTAPFESIAERRKTTCRRPSRADTESLSNASDARSHSSRARKASGSAEKQSNSKPRRHADRYTATVQLSQDPSAIALRKSRAEQPASKASNVGARQPQPSDSLQETPPTQTLENHTPLHSLTMPSSSKCEKTKLTPARVKNRAISRIFNKLQRGMADDEGRKTTAQDHWQEAKRRHEEEEADSDVEEDDVKTEEPADTIQVHNSSLNSAEDWHPSAEDNGVPAGDQEYVPDDDKSGMRTSTRRNSDIAAVITAAAAQGIKVTPSSLRDIEQYTTPDEGLDWTNEPDGKKRAKMQSVISSRKYLATKKARKVNGPAAAQAFANLRNGHNAGAGNPRAVKRPRRRLQEDVTTATSQQEKEAEEDTEEDLDESFNEPVEETEVAQLSHDESLGLSNEEIIKQIKEVLASRSERGKTRDFGFKAAGRILDLLNAGELATESSDDVLFTTPESAAEWCQAGKFFEGPIIVSGAQPLPLQTVDQFFDEHYDDSIYVHVQDPAIRLASNGPHVRKVKLAEVKKRFAKGTTDKPWNCLELATHVEDGLRPTFLNNEDCRLLTKVKFPSKEDEASRNGYFPGWKEVEKWALVAQGGALTEPHQDSHGYSTYISVNQGLIGYGWLARPTEEERAAWNRSHSQYIGGRWRYTILRPGQTVYFPAGTVHFVFRLPAVGPTLAFGGHVLRNSQIVNWVKTLIAEQASPQITNEDLTVSAPAYMNRVHKFVLQALKAGPHQTDKWGGTPLIAEFMELKTKYENAVERKLEELGMNGRKCRSRKHRAASDD